MAMAALETRSFEVDPPPLPMLLFTFICAYHLLAQEVKIKIGTVIAALACVLSVLSCFRARTPNTIYSSTHSKFKLVYLFPATQLPTLTGSIPPTPSLLVTAERWTSACGRR